jgi:hypothetical protein
MKFTISHDTPAAKLGYGTIPAELRGEIKGTVTNTNKKLGGEMSNAKYAEEKGISKRQASKQRRGY